MPFWQGSGVAAAESARLAGFSARMAGLWGAVGGNPYRIREDSGQAKRRGANPVRAEPCCSYLLPMDPVALDPLLAQRVGSQDQEPVSVDPTRSWLRPSVAQPWRRGSTQDACPSTVRAEDTPLIRKPRFGCRPFPDPQIPCGIHRERGNRRVVFPRGPRFDTPFTPSQSQCVIPPRPVCPFGDDDRGGRATDDAQEGSIEGELANLVLVAVCDVSCRRRTPAASWEVSASSKENRLCR